MGLAPQIVEEIFEIVKNLNTKEKVSFLLAEQNTMVALRFADFGYILENGRVVMEGTAHALSENEDVKEFYLGISTSGPQELPRHQELPAPQALAVVMGEHFDALETREPAARERELMARLPAQVALRAQGDAPISAACSRTSTRRRSARGPRWRGSRSRASPRCMRPAEGRAALRRPQRDAGLGARAHLRLARADLRPGGPPPRLLAHRARASSPRASAPATWSSTATRTTSRPPAACSRPGCTASAAR